MGMNPAPQTETFVPPEDHQWLGSEHGTQNAHPGTLDGSAFAAIFTDGVVPSGVAVSLYTSGANAGLWGPYDDDGLAGLAANPKALFTTCVLNGGDGDTPAAILHHGQIRVSKLPTDHGWTADAKSAAQGSFEFLTN